MLNYNLSDNYEGSSYRRQGQVNFYSRQGAPRGSRGGGRDKYYDYWGSNCYRDRNRYRDWGQEYDQEACPERGKADQGAHLHLAVDLADQTIDPFSELMNRISLRRMDLEEIFKMKTIQKN